MHNNKNNSDAHSVSHITTSISADIIAWMKQVRKAYYNNNITEDDRTTSSSSKCKAKFGSVGDLRIIVRKPPNVKTDLYGHG